MLSLASVSVSSFAGSAPLAARRASAVTMETVDDLKALSNKLNPTLGYWNPTGLADMEFWGQSNEASIGWLRQAEIKHGRVAMMAFVGFLAGSNGIVFPWAQDLDGTTFAKIAEAGGPASQWDALPTQAKLQILGVIGFFEFWSENTYALAASGEKHYMRGGKPGAFPSFKSGGLPHPVPFDLYDPLGFSKKMAPEKKEKRLLMEINNGRLAMIGIMGFLSEAKVPGSVPLLKGLVTPYDGDIMAPFSAGDTELAFVGDMLDNHFVF